MIIKYPWKFICCISVNFIISDLTPSINLVTALKSCILDGVTSVTMKLTKKDGKYPVIAFIITKNSHTNNANDLILTQQVPCKVLSPAQSSEIPEPNCPEGDVHIHLPPLSTLKPVIERMKSISSFLYVCANMNGEMVFRVETDMVKVETFYKNLVNPELDPSQVDITTHPSTKRSVKEFVEGRVDIKDFIRFIASSGVNPLHVVCSIAEGYCVNVFVYLGAVGGQEVGTITYFIPIRSL